MYHHNILFNMFCAVALSVAADIKNRVTSHGEISLTTLSELVFDRAPNISHIRRFAGRCWFSNRSKSSFKLGEGATEAILIVYARCLKSFKMCDLAYSSVVVPQDG